MDLTELDLKEMRWRYPRFFTEIDPDNELQTVSGSDVRHIRQALRMRAGDKAVLSHDCTDYLCELAEAGDEAAVFRVISKEKNTAEADIYVRLFQCVPKHDKLEIIAQKATELGVMEITPVFSERCVSKPDLKSQVKKNERLQKIAEEAAKQSGRGKIPTINPFTTFNEAINEFDCKNTGIIFYEIGGERLNEILGSKPLQRVDIFIGSEGGFSQHEISAATKKNIVAATLGGRILRVETAPVAAISILMNLTGNM